MYFSMVETRSFTLLKIPLLTQVYHCLAQIEAENPDLADV
jgi:hypothetical protein